MKRILVLLLFIVLLVGCSSPTASLEEKLSGEWLVTDKFVEYQLDDGSIQYLGIHDSYNYFNFTITRKAKQNPDDDYIKSHEFEGKELFYKLSFEEGISVLRNFTNSDVRVYDMDFISDNTFFNKLNLSKSKSDLIDQFTDDGYEVTVNFINEDTIELSYFLDEEQFKDNDMFEGIISLNATSRYTRNIKVNE